MAKRIKKTRASQLKTREEFRAAVSDCAELQRMQNQAKLKLAQRIARMQEESESHIDDLGKQIDGLYEEIRAYADDHREEEFVGRKTIDLAQAIVGYRMNPPSVKKGRKFRTLADVAKHMLALPWAQKYVAERDPTIDKPAILADRGNLTAEQLIEVGLKIEQEEVFFIEPKDEPLEQGVRS